MEKPTRDDVRVDSWQERDRLGIWVTDTRTDKTIAEWWDDAARQMFEDGFFKPGVPLHSWEKPSPAFVNSVLDYLEDTGVLAKESQSSSQAPEPAVSGEGRKYLTGRRWELIGYSWRQNIVTEKWDTMRVFGDGSSDPAEVESYNTQGEAQLAAEKLARKKNVPVFPPERNHAVFYTAD